MHVIFLSLDYPADGSGGGVGTYTRTVARALVRQGCRVSVIVLRSPGGPDFWQDGGVRVHAFRQGNLHWYLSRIPLLGRRVALPVRELERSWRGWRLLRGIHAREAADVVEITETAGFFTALFMKSVPVVGRLHGELFTFHQYTPDIPLTLGVRLSRILQRAALRRCRCLVSPSRAHAEEIRKELGRHCPPVEVLPPPIEVNETAEEVVPSRFPFPGDVPCVLFVGRLERCKGVPLLLEAARRVLREIPETRFVLAGADHPTLTREALDGMMAERNLKGHVHIAGHLPRSRLFAWFKRAWLCVLPSYYETFGIAAAEAMAHGLPVVATDAGGLSEIVEDGVTGIVVPPGDAPALSKAICRLLRDAGLRDRMGEAGRSRFGRNYDVERVVKRTLEVYRGVVTGDGIPATFR